MTGFGFDGDVVTRHHRSRIVHLGEDQADASRGLRRADPAGEPLLPLPVDPRPDRGPGGRGGARGDDRLRLQPAPLRPRAAVRSHGLPGRRPARPGRLPRAGPVPGASTTSGGSSAAPTWTIPASSIVGSAASMISSREPVPVQLDGDPAGLLGHRGQGAQRSPPRPRPRREWAIEVIPSAVDVLIPRPKAGPSSARQDSRDGVRIPRRPSRISRRKHPAPNGRAGILGGMPSRQRRRAWRSRSPIPSRSVR